MNSNKQSMYLASGLNMKEHASAGYSKQTSRVHDIDGKQLQNAIVEIESLRKCNSILETEVLETRERCTLLETLLQLKYQEFSQFCENIKTDKMDWQHENEPSINMCFTPKENNDFLKTSMKYLKSPGTGSSLLKNNILDDIELKSKRKFCNDNIIDFKDDFKRANVKSEDETRSLKKREDVIYKDILIEHDKKYDEVNGKSFTRSKFDEHTCVNKKTSKEYETPNDEYTCTRENLDSMVENLMCTQQELHLTVLSLNKETISRLETSKINDRLEAECRYLRRNLLVCQTENNKMSDDHERLKNEYTCTRKNLNAMVEKFMNIQKELHVTKLRLKEERICRLEMSEINDRLEDECRCLRRNLRVCQNENTRTIRFSSIVSIVYKNVFVYREEY